MSCTPCASSTTCTSCTTCTLYLSYYFVALATCTITTARVGIGDLPINDHRPSPMCCWVLNQCSRVHFQLRRMVYIQWWCIYTMVVYAPMSALMYTSNYGLIISLAYISIYTAAYTSNFNGWHTTNLFNSPHVHLRF